MKDVISTGALVKVIADKAKTEGLNLTAKDVSQVINLLKDAICEELVKGNKVKLTSFVTFETYYRVARKGYNVAAGKPMQIPASVAVVSKVGKDLKVVKSQMSKATIEKLKGTK